VLGPERGALSPQLVARCDYIVRIPTSFCVNLAMAGAMPFDSLRVFSTASVTRTLGGFAFTRTLTRTNVNSTRTTVKIVITPTSSTSLKDSVTFDRTKPSTSTPLCTSC
jgi:hypothetical protein